VCFYMATLFLLSLVVVDKLAFLFALYFVVCAVL